MKDLFVSGMFRSGTTFIARALNTHPNIILASDPYFEFFKHTRNLFFRDKVQNFDEAHPLEDYCFCEYSTLLKEYHKRFYSIEYNQEEIDILKEKIKNRAMPFSPLVIPFVDQLKPGTVEDVLSSLNNIVHQAYPKEDAEYIGTKHVWTDEYISLLTGRKDLEYKSIHLIRDPRGVIASSKKDQDGAYPVLFLIRQWRKSVGYAILNKENENCLTLRYEDIISNPKAYFDQICGFLNVPYSEDLLDVSKYKDGAGEQWYQNSSYSKYDKGQTINAKSINKWEGTLNSEELEIIESLCVREMQYMNYDLSTKASLPLQSMLDYNKQDLNIAEWIKKYNFEFTPERIQQEFMRNYLLNPSMANKLGDDLIDHIFIDSRIYKELQRIEP